VACREASGHVITKAERMVKSDSFSPMETKTTDPSDNEQKTYAFIVL